MRYCRDVVDYIPGRLSSLRASMQLSAATVKHSMHPVGYILILYACIHPLHPYSLYTAVYIYPVGPYTHRIKSTKLTSYIVTNVRHVSEPPCSG